MFVWVLKIYAGSVAENTQAKRLNQGLNYFISKKYVLAEAEFKAILALNPNNVLAYYNLGLTKYKQGDYPGAIKNFDVVTKMSSFYTGAAFYYKSISHLNLEQTEDAIRTVKQYKKAK